MRDIRQTIGRNIVLLRGKVHLTQAEFAAQLNYTDKAVSKWERGESVPDIAVLKQIADLFGVSVDYLLQEHEESEPIVLAEELRDRQHDHLLISLIAVFGVWGLAVLAFCIGYGAFDVRLWQAFIVALPVSSIVALVFNSIWGKRRYNYLIISILLWSLLATVYLLLLRYNPWTVFLLGVPGQICIILSSRLRITRKHEKRAKPDRWD